MKKFRVIILPTAQEQLDNLYRYIENASGGSVYAKQQYNRIRDAIQTLKAFPERCRMEGYLGGMPLHRLLQDNYSIFYTISESVVFVNFILHSRSNIPARLGKNFSKRKQ